MADALGALAWTSNRFSAFQAEGAQRAPSGKDEASTLSGGAEEERVLVLPMPKLSHAMTHGRIAKWHIAEGASIATYDVLLTVETETLVEEAYRVDQFAGKVALLVESQEEGYVAQLLAAEGDEVPVGKPIALLCERQEDVADVRESAGRLGGVSSVYNSGSGSRLRVLEWQSYLAQGPRSSTCL